MPQEGAAVGAPVGSDQVHDGRSGDEDRDEDRPRVPAPVRLVDRGLPPSQQAGRDREEHRRDDERHAGPEEEIPGVVSPGVVGDARRLLDSEDQHEIAGPGGEPNPDARGDLQ